MMYKRLINQIINAETALAKEIYKREVIPFMKRYKVTLEYGMGSVEFVKKNGDRWSTYYDYAYDDKAGERRNSKNYYCDNKAAARLNHKITSILMNTSIYDVKGNGCTFCWMLERIKAPEGVVV